jgi:hypothetical protein
MSFYVPDQFLVAPQILPLGLLLGLSLHKFGSACAVLIDSFHLRKSQFYIIATLGTISNFITIITSIVGLDYISMDNLDDVGGLLTYYISITSSCLSATFVFWLIDTRMQVFYNNSHAILRLVRGLCIAGFIFKFISFILLIIVRVGEFRNVPALAVLNFDCRQWEWSLPCPILSKPLVLYILLPCSCTRLH